MTFYIAVCCETKIPRIFQEHEFEKLQKFSQKHKYSYDYFEVEVGHIIPIPETKLFLFNT